MGWGRDDTPCGGDETTVYRIYVNPGNGELLLYVGVSEWWERRFAQHRKNKPWWNTDNVEVIRLEHWCCRRHAEDRERELIRDEAPLLNIDHNLGRHVDWL